MADAAPPSSPVPPPPRPRTRSLWPAAFTVVAIALIAAISAGVWWAGRGVSSVGRAAVDHAVELAKATLSPQVVRQEVVNVIFERPDHTPKLVVLTEPVRVVIERSDELHWLYVYWGTSSVRIELVGNRVQWFVDLNRLREDRVVVDEAAGTVRIYVPPPQLDREMVVVQNDPRYVRVETERGWARLPASARTLAESARQQIVPTILEAADKPASRDQATRAAVTAVDALLRPLLRPYLQERDLTLEVVAGEPPRPPAEVTPAAISDPEPSGL